MSEGCPLVDEKACGMQPYLRYQGGKSKLAKRIVKVFPSHRVYVEPMVGGGSVFLAKCPAEKEVISDVDGNLMGFWRGLKNGEVKRCDLTPNYEKVKQLVEKRKKGLKLKPCDYLILIRILSEEKDQRLIPDHSHYAKAIRQSDAKSPVRKTRLMLNGLKT